MISVEGDFEKLKMQCIEKQCFENKNITLNNMCVWLRKNDLVELKVWQRLIVLPNVRFRVSKELKIT